jgi:hypothetical protein
MVAKRADGRSVASGIAGQHINQPAYASHIKKPLTGGQSGRQPSESKSVPLLSHHGKNRVTYIATASSGRTQRMTRLIIRNPIHFEFTSLAVAVSTFICRLLFYLLTESALPQFVEALRAFMR